MKTFFNKMYFHNRSSTEEHKSVVSFISPLLVHFKLSNIHQQKYGVIIRKKCFPTQTGYIYE